MRWHAHHRTAGAGHVYHGAVHSWMARSAGVCSVCAVRWPATPTQEGEALGTPARDGRSARHRVDGSWDGDDRVARRYPDDRLETVDAGRFESLASLGRECERAVDQGLGDHDLTVVTRALEDPGSM